MNQDLEHLNLLGIFHYVVAAVLALFSCLPILYLIIGILAVTGSLDEPSGSDGVIVGCFFIAFALFFIFAGLTMAITVAYAGRFLQEHRHYYYCLVMAGIACMFSPFGTVLGVFTIIVLLRPSVKLLFGVAPPAETQPRS